jgi:2-polyprenyl-6-methoxyphenol hydroxylase-like FAD-dependent oxidoreductase
VQDVGNQLLRSGMRVIVIGGGICGVTTAIALQRAGIEASVFERAPAPAEVGAGISIWGNAIKALRAIDAAGPVLALGEVMERGELRTSRGRLLSHAPVGEYDRRLGAPSVLLHRAELLGALLGQLPDRVVRFGRRCVGFHECDGGVAVKFDDGQEEPADLLVGADGINSVVRAQLLSDGPARYSGYTCWRGVAKVPESMVARGYVCEAWGRGQRFGIVRIGDGRVYWFATRNAAPNQQDPPTGPKPLLASMFARWFDPIPRLIEATPPEAIIHNDILDRPPVTRWSSRRVVLLGDAAHPTTPNIGQGACMAIEDAVLLARLLGGGGDPAHAFEEFERRRMPRTARITRFSWRLGRIAQLENPLGCMARNGLMCLTPRAMIRADHRRTVGYEV